MAPLLPLWGGRPAALCLAPLSSSVHPFPVYAFGQGRGAAPGAGCGLRPAGQSGGGGGWSVSRPSGGVARGPEGRGVVLPRSVPLPPLGGQHCGHHRRCSGHWGAAPILLLCVVVRRPRAWPVRCSCALVRVRPPAATPAGAGSRGCGGARRPGPAPSPSRASRSFLGEGGRPLGRGGGRGSAPPWPAGRRGVGGRGEGGPRRSSLLLRPGGRPVAPSPVPLPLWRTLPGYKRVAGRLWALGAVPSAAGGSVRGGGGEVFSPWPAPPPSPGGHHGGRPRLRIPGRHRAVAAHCAGAEPPAGSGLCGSERAADQGRLARACVRCGCGVSPLGAAAPPGGVRGRRLCGQPPAANGLGGGGGEGGGRGGGGSPRHPSGPLAPPPNGREGRPGGSGPGGSAADRGGRTFPSPP